MSVTIVCISTSCQEKNVQNMNKMQINDDCSQHLRQKLDKTNKKHKNMYKYI